MNNLELYALTKALRTGATEEQNAELMAWLKKSLTITVIDTELTNTLKYPFNNSETTVSFKTEDVRQTQDYVVTAEIVESTGEVGHIIIRDKTVNGFKVAYTGGALSARLKLYVQGGN